MNLSNLKASLPATMAGIAAKAGLKLAFGQPRTNGETVWVTDIPLNPTEDDYYVTLGDLGHEVAHIKYTDFSVFGSGLSQALNNVFEDVRIERLLEQEFLGMREFLDESYKIVLDKGEQRKPDSLANALTMFLLTKYMIDINNRHYFAKDRDDALSVLEQEVVPDIIEQIVALCDPRVPNLGSTQDCLDLANDVIALLQQQSESNDDNNDDSQEEESNSDDSNQDSSSGDNDSEEGDSESDSGSNADSDSNDDSNEDSSSDGNASGDESSDASDGSDSGSASNGAKELLESKVEESSPISLRELAEKAAQEASDSSNSLKEQMGDSDDIGQDLRQSGFGENFYRESEISPNLLRYNRIKAGLGKEVQLLKKQLIRLWTSNSRSRKIVNEHDGAFSVDEGLRCLSTGEDNFLVKKTRRKNHKPAVCLVGDLSYSMNDDDGFSGKRLIDLQTETMTALAETCSAINLPLNIIGFDDSLYSIKKWNEPMTKSRAMIGGCQPLHNTNLNAATFEAIRSVMTRKESRKIIIIMTDGDVGRWQKEGIRNLEAFAEKACPGVEIYGLGIGVNLSGIYKNGGMVNNSKMAETVLNILAK